MCTLGGSRTARSVFFSWPIALWRPPYSFWLFFLFFFFYNRKIQWCPFVFVCQAVLSGICLALEELGSALLPRWNNNTTSSSTAAPLTLKGAVLFFFFLVSAVFLASCRSRRIRESKEKSKFQIYRLQSNEGDVVKRETTKKLHIILSLFCLLLLVFICGPDELSNGQENERSLWHFSIRFFSFFCVYFRHLDVFSLALYLFLLDFLGFFSLLLWPVKYQLNTLGIDSFHPRYAGHPSPPKRNRKCSKAANNPFNFSCVCVCVHIIGAALAQTI